MVRVIGQENNVAIVCAFYFEMQLLIRAEIRVFEDYDSSERALHSAGKRRAIVVLPARSIDVQ